MSKIICAFASDCKQPREQRAHEHVITKKLTILITMRRLLTLLFVAIAYWGTIFASDTQVDGIWYDFDDNTMTATVTYKGRDYVIDGHSYAGSIIIPHSVLYAGSTYTVTDIGTYAFLECVNLTSVVILNGVTRIGDYAFMKCNKMISIEIPNSITSIGEAAFSGCSGLTSITFSNSVTSIGKEAFKYCNNLPVENNIRYADTYLVEAIDKTLSLYTIKEGTQYIGKGAFRDCTNLLSVTIPNSVTDIGESAFNQCTALKSVFFGNSVRLIGPEAFSGCQDLTSISFPYSLTNIEYWAFLGCAGLTNIEIPNSVTTIGNQAFSFCSSLTSVTIGENVTNMHSPFTDCPNLTNVVWNVKNYPSFNQYRSPFYDNRSQIESFTFGETVDTIPTYLCYGMSKLSTIIIPENITKIGSFSDCSNLTKVIWNAKNCNSRGYFDSQVDTFVFGENVELIPSSCCEELNKLTTISIPNSVKAIGDKAFLNCTSLVSVKFGNGITDIGNKAFYGCSSLKGELIIPNSVTNLGERTFDGCKNITSIIIGDNVQNISEGSFFMCFNLTKVTIPGSVTSIGDCAFSYCTKLAKIFNYASIPQTIFNNTFNSVDKSQCVLYVPEESIDLYRAADVWKEFTNIQAIPGSSVTYYTVVFQSWDGTELKNERIEEGLSAVAPDDPTRKGYTFIGWDTEYDNVTKDLIITALFEKNAPEPETPTSFAIDLNTAKEMAYTDCSAVLTVEEDVLIVNYSAGSWQWAGVEFDLEHFTEITNISFEYQGDGQNIVIYPYLRDAEGNRWRKNNYWLRLYNTEWLTETTYMPDTLLWDKADYQFGEKSFVKLGFVANPGTATEGSFKIRNIQIQGIRDIKTCSWLVESNDVQMGSIQTSFTKSSYDFGTVIEVEAIPNEGYQFVKWNNGKTDNPYNFELEQDTYLRAIFVAEGTTVEQTEVQPTATTATFTWPLVVNGYIYTLSIYLDAEQTDPICDIFFNQFGEFINRVFHAPSRYYMPTEEAFAYTITDLTPNTRYYYRMIAEDVEERLLNTDDGSFETISSPTAIEEITNDQISKCENVKILHDGQIFILREDRVYTLTGQVIR